MFNTLVGELYFETQFVGHLGSPVDKCQASVGFKSDLRYFLAGDPGEITLPSLCDSSLLELILREKVKV